jgi:hypothetical protein
MFACLLKRNSGASLRGSLIRTEFQQKGKVWQGSQTSAAAAGLLQSIELQPGQPARG